MKPPLINGWDFKPEDYQRAWNNGNLLTASIETSNICNLACDYCFREEQATTTKKRLPGEISLTESLQLIDELATLGAQTINIAGAGEPLLDNNLPSMLTHLHDHGMTPLVATNGATINDDWIELFKYTNTSIMLKVNSFEQEKQDMLVNRKDYANRRDKALQKLIATSFNEQGEDYQTRLSINALVSKDTIEEIPTIFTYCRENNIMPCMETFIPAGRTATHNDKEVSKKEFQRLAKDLQAQDKERGITYDQLWPYLGGVPCTQQGKASLYVDIQGGIYDCPARTTHYGNLKETTTTEAFEQIKKQETNYCLGCPARDLHNL